MKRSEMLVILEDIIYDEICLEDWTPTCDEGNLSRILDRLEKAGMLPPARLQAFQCIRQKPRIKQVYSWEPEDDSLKKLNESLDKLINDEGWDD